MHINNWLRDIKKNLSERVGNLVELYEKTSLWSIFKGDLPNAPLLHLRGKF